MLRIANPQAKPTSWTVIRRRLPEGPGSLRLGSACLADGDYLYAYGLFPKAACKPLHTPLGLARIPLGKLVALDMKAWEYWCQSKDGNTWKDKPADPVALFSDGAPEMSVSPVRGMSGFFAVYTPLGLGGDIVVRGAPRPEGPWSKSVQVYHCPEAGDKLLLYGAKAHPELSQRDGQLVITYCRNTGALAEHVRRPDIYFPQAVTVQLHVNRISR